MEDESFAKAERLLEKVVFASLEGLRLPAIATGPCAFWICFRSPVSAVQTM